MLEEQLQELETLVKTLKALELDNMTKSRLESFRATASRLATIAHYVESASQSALTITEQSMMEDITAMWRDYAVQRGKNPETKVCYNNWCDAYEADGVKLGNSVKEVYTFLKAQTT